MEECFDDARQRGADMVWLQVWKEAPWAVGFYERMGFAVVGSAPFYFGERVGDDHVMAAYLPGAAYAVFVPLRASLGKIPIKPLEIRLQCFAE